VFDACEGCGGFPDHSVNGPKCVQIRAERVRAAQLAADALDAAKDANELETPYPPPVD
jgi:hypothetical protein